MQSAERVTFGGGGLDRAAHLRGGSLGELLGRPDARVVPMNGGRPAVGAGRLALLEAGHPVFAGAGEPVFLGLAGGIPVFARAVAGVEPAASGAWDTAEAIHPALAGATFVDLRTAMTHLAPDEAEIVASARAILGWHGAHGFCAGCGAATRMAQAGWLRECPVCGAHHFPRTDPVVIMLITRGNAALVGRCPGWPAGNHSLLAGFVEPGETVEGAVRREVFEETGVRVGRVGYLASQPWPFPRSLMLGCFGEALSEAIDLDPAELEAARWITREDMVAVFAGTHPEVRPPRAGAIARFLIEAWLADRLD